MNRNDYGDELYPNIFNRDGIYSIYLSNPLKKHTDSDTINDYDELTKYYFYTKIKPENFNPSYNVLSMLFKEEIFIWLVGIFSIMKARTVSVVNNPEKEMIQ